MIAFPRGERFRVEVDGPSRGYVCENYGGSFTLPDRGPIGANCLANPRDFLTPVAAYEDVEKPCTLYVKWGGELFRTKTGEKSIHARSLVVLSKCLEPLPLGKTLRFFGDGYQISKKFGGKRYWRVPVMDGEFLCEDVTRVTKGVGGGNFLILAEDQPAALEASERAIRAMRKACACARSTVRCTAIA